MNFFGMQTYSRTRCIRIIEHNKSSVICKPHLPVYGPAGSKSENFEDAFPKVVAHVLSDASERLTESESVGGGCSAGRIG